MILPLVISIILVITCLNRMRETQNPRWAILGIISSLLTVITLVGTVVDLINT
jgi:hypothetical protein